MNAERASPSGERTVSVPAGSRIDIRGSLPRAALVAAGTIFVLTAAELLFGLRPGIETLLFLNDVQSLLVIVAVLLAVAFWRIPAVLSGSAWRVPPPRLTAPLLALLAGMACLAGTYLVFGRYALSYDEVMAVFDAEIFRSGLRIAPLPSEWRGFRHALAPSFLLPVPGEVAWVSAYLPVNAALRALVGSAADPAWTGPILLIVAVLALNGIARQLWPDRPDAAFVATLLLVTAPQVLATAMTPYAMTAHLAFNLVWLRLFLRGGLLGHAGAAATGVLACGLHQLVFHPLFAAPFLVFLIVDRRWRLAAFYGTVYAAAGLVWILYWQVLLAAQPDAGNAAAAVGADWFLRRFTTLLAAFDPGSFDLMTKNLLRFAAWQNPLLLPLVGLAWPAFRRGERPAWSLGAGIGLTLLVVAVLLPFQGHGWGYRYLHGLIGSACLLAARGWIALTERATASQAAAARGAFAVSCLAALLVLIPVRAHDVRDAVAPYAAASRAIGSADADIVALRAGGALYGRDLVRNDPFLRNRPIIVLLDDLDAAHRAALCSRGRIVEFGPQEARRFGIVGDYREESPASSRNVLPCTTGRVTVPERY